MEKQSKKQEEETKKESKKKLKKEKNKIPKEPLPDLEQKKSKDTYITASNFDPYLTGEKNNFAYPTAPHILKFQS